jgi:hypothetical protein
MGGRVDVKADDVAQLLGELRIVGQLEPPPSVRLQAVGLPAAASIRPDLADSSWSSNEMAVIPNTNLEFEEIIAKLRPSNCRRLV